jgi:hypothetical protein
VMSKYFPNAWVVDYHVQISVNYSSIRLMITNELLPLTACMYIHRIFR